MKVEEKVLKIQENDNKEIRNNLIKDYTPFIIKATSEVLNRYIEIENDEEYMVALEAFNEAIDKFDYNKGGFLTFAKVIIRSRILDFLKGKKIDIDDSKEVNDEKSLLDIPKKVSISYEIEKYKKILKSFGLDFEILSENSPSHKQTRCRCFFIAKEINKHQEYIDWIKNKKRLPVTKLSRDLDISKRIIKYSKNYILSLALVYIHDLDELKDYIEKLGGECDEKR